MSGNGIIAATVARECGITTSGVMRWADDLGVPRVGSGHSREWTPQQVRALKVALALHDMPGHGCGGGPRYTRNRFTSVALAAAVRPGTWLVVPVEGKPSVHRTARSAVQRVQALQCMARVMRVPS